MHRMIARPRRDASTSGDIGSAGAIIRWVGCALLCLGLLGCATGGNQPEPEIIRSFVAEPATITAGQSATLKWHVNDAREVSLGGLPAPAGWSETSVSPIRTTTYRLTAVAGAGQTATREVTVTVDEGPILAKVAIDPQASGPTLPGGFLGLSHSAAQAQLLMGDPSIGANPVYRQLLANLMRDSAGPLSLRIARDGTGDASVPDRSLTTALASLHQEMSGIGEGVQYILGLDMKQGVPGLARMQAQTYTQNLPAQAIHAFELGSRPDLFVEQGHRQTDYDFAEYFAEYQLYAEQLQEVAGSSLVTTAPSTAPGSESAQGEFAEPAQVEHMLMSAFDVIGEVSQYPVSGTEAACEPAHLLQPAMSTRAVEQLHPYLQVARRAAKPYRLIEVDTAICGEDAAASDTFAAALWLADALFEQAYAGVSAVNVQSNLWAAEGGWDPQGLFHVAIPAQQYKVSAARAAPPAEDAFSTEYSLRRVLPQYYALLFFAEATARQAELLPVSVASDDNVKAWATRDRQTGRITIALINKDRQAFGRVRLEMPGYTRGEVKRLTAATIETRDQIRFGGQTFDGSTDGVPLGVEQRERVELTDGVLEVALDAGSAMLLRLGR
ncbi:Glycosyl hydrolase family 79 C-terminal beta domain-containing protein [Halopseudomonas xinjiangensis]|uniref:Glycosyl hydrolase family 79 C-terminal beta domain-containing protein n=1 Tax=Halopseudomonas xinjiangensis TaxID=487184 RepID=A0A1H1Y916_9GAMM|nr:glycosyl hydrolase family 79 C-terminal domain-containing protein [Halopseudomonas xinjiangensis]SDT17854.1 Glycosyl hydrolase family 79 C-terminal beta domain-containing protein [Halopseudomonas xinjiangensis]